MSLEQAARGKDIDLDQVIRELEAAQDQSRPPS
jgi:hypothetical protein